MKWWNDLWLNESFADFISHYCLENIKNDVKTITYTSGWAAFVERKVRGYTEDQMVTTHPIRGPVPNTSVAGSIFDGITYQKGASTLKQLMFVMGSDAFFSGLKKYFK
jgi:aminopeptidase N